MPTNDEIIKLVLQTAGQEGVQGLRDSIEALKAKLVELGVQARDDTADVDTLMNRLEGGTNSAAKGTANLGYAIRDLGRATQDFAQGGIGGILNNIEGLATSLGAGAGVGGGLTLLAVTLATVGKPILSWFASLGDATDGVRKTKEELEELRKKMEETSKAVETLIKGPSSADLAMGDESDWRKKFLLGLGSEEIGGIRSGLLQGLDSSQIDDLRRRRDQLAGSSDKPSPNVLREIVDLNNKLKAAESARTDQADRMILDLMTGGRAAFEDVVGALPAGPIRDRLAGGSTDAFNQHKASIEGQQRAAAQRKADAEIEAQRVKDEAEARKAVMEQIATKQAADLKAAADKVAFNHQTEQLNQQGQANEDAFRRAEAQRIKQEAEDAREAARKAPYEEAAQAIRDVDNAYGIGFTPDQVADAARQAVGLARRGVDTNNAILGAIRGVLKEAAQTREMLQRQMMWAQNLQMQSESAIGFW